MFAIVLRCPGVSAGDELDVRILLTVCPVQVLLDRQHSL